MRRYKTIIRVRRNAVEELRCQARRRALTMQREDHNEWRRKYGLRWIGQSTFSWMKNELFRAENS